MEWAGWTCRVMVLSSLRKLGQSNQRMDVTDRVIILCISTACRRLPLLCCLAVVVYDSAIGITFKGLTFAIAYHIIRVSSNVLG